MHFNSVSRRSSGVRFFLGLFVFFAESAAALAAEHRFVAWHSSNFTKPCEQTLQEFEMRFSGLTGLQVLESRCGAPVAEQEGGMSYRFRPMSLIYVAPKPITIHSIFLGDAVGPVNPHATGDYSGAFATLVECESALRRLVPLAESETGLAALSSGCSRAKSRFAAEEAKWVAQVDAFVGESVGEAGTPRKTLHVQSLSSSPSILTYIPPAVQEDVRNRLLAGGVRIAHELTGKFWYFSERPIPLTLWPVFGLDGEQTCELQRVRIAQILSRLGTAAAPTFHCVGRTETARELKTGVGIWNGRKHVGLNPIARERYTSLQECLSGLARLDRNPPYDGSFKVTLGMICVRGMNSLDGRNLFEARAVEVAR